MKMVILAAGLGSRMREVCGDRPKALADLGSETILDRLLATARALGLDPMILTRPEYVACFQDVRAEVLVEEKSVGMLTTLYQARNLVHEPFVWVGGDLVVSETEPLRELIQGHDPDSFASFFFCRTDRFKAKIRFEPEVQVVTTREGEWELSLPHFVVQSPRIFSYMADNPEGNFLATALAAGERVAFREYPHKIFEIDDPSDLAEARAWFARCESRASIS